MKEKIEIHELMMEAMASVLGNELIRRRELQKIKALRLPWGGGLGKMLIKTGALRRIK